MRRISIAEELGGHHLRHGQFAGHGSRTGRECRHVLIYNAVSPAAAYWVSIMILVLGTAILLTGKSTKPAETV